MWYFYKEATEQIDADAQVGLAFARNSAGCGDALATLAAMGLTPSSRGWVEELGQLLVPDALRRLAFIANAFLMVLPAQVLPSYFDGWFADLLRLHQLFLFAVKAF